MFCKNCGSPLDDNASFCGNCGAKVNQEKAQAEPSSNKKKHSPLKFVFLILALLLVCGGLYATVGLNMRKNHLMSKIEESKVDEYVTAGKRLNKQWSKLGITDFSDKNDLLKDFKKINKNVSDFQSCCKEIKTMQEEKADYDLAHENYEEYEKLLSDCADAIKEEKYRIRAGRIIDHVIGWASANDWRIPEHFTKEWKADLDCNKECPADRFKPYGATPGHGIEWARLIVQWAYSSYKDTPDSAEVYLKAAEKLYNRAVEDSWNVDGNPGIVYTTDWDGKPVVHDRMHWTLAEAINTSAVLCHITHKQKYAKDYEEFMRYLDDKVLDHKNGSWFHQLDENNNVIGTVWPGKSDVYHAFQSTWIPYGTPYISIASDVKQYMEVCHQ